MVGFLNILVPVPVERFWPKADRPFMKRRALKADIEGNPAKAGASVRITGRPHYHQIAEFAFAGVGIVPERLCDLARSTLVHPFLASASW
jgi:hypothetical protein